MEKEENDMTKEVEIYDKISMFLAAESLIAPDERIRFLELLRKEFRL